MSLRSIRTLRTVKFGFQVIAIMISWPTLVIVAHVAIIKENQAVVFLYLWQLLLNLL